jgi:hypothetical protein
MLAPTAQKCSADWLDGIASRRRLRDLKQPYLLHLLALVEID